MQLEPDKRNLMVLLVCLAVVALIINASFVRYPLTSNSPNYSTAASPSNPDGQETIHKLLKLTSEWSESPVKSNQRDWGHKSRVKEGTFEILYIRDQDHPEIPPVAIPRGQIYKHDGDNRISRPQYRVEGASSNEPVILEIWITR